jgi:DNA polymerase-1
VPSSYLYKPENRCFSEETMMKTTVEGQTVYTNALFGAVNRIFFMIRSQKITHIAICCDVDRETLLRKKRFPDYKGNRTDTPEPLKQQLLWGRWMFQAFGWRVLFHEGFEADDFAASVTNQFKGKLPIFLYTQDADYLQLVEEGVTLWQLQKDKTSWEQTMAENILPEEQLWPYKCIPFDGPRTFLLKGYWPEQVIHMKGLAGDVSDNIPGVTGIGEKTARQLLWKYKTVEGVFQRMEELGEIEFKSELKTFMDTRCVSKLTAEGAKEQALLSKGLGTMVKNLKVPTELDRYAISNGGRFEDIQLILNTLQIQSVEIPQCIPHRPPQQY